MADDLTSRLSEDQNNFGIGDIDQDRSISELPSFDIYLNRTSDEGSHLRTNPSDHRQRANYTERKGAVDICWSALDVVHGDFSLSGDLFCHLNRAATPL